jgi:hypothetical protein
MKRFLIAAFMGLFAVAAPSYSQGNGQDVFVPISKYIEAGQYENLSAWFADNLELDVLGSVNNCSKNQAKLIVKSFFNEYTPKKFTIVHRSSKGTMMYAIGSLQAGGDKFRVTMYVKTSEKGENYILQFRIEKE